jgi:hypothetical protein
MFDMCILLSLVRIVERHYTRQILAVQGFQTGVGTGAKLGHSDSQAGLSHCQAPTVRIRVTDGSIVHSTFLL